MRALSMRWRLTLWNTLALAIVLLGFTALVYGLMRHALYERIDRSLLTELQELEQKPNQDLAYWIHEAKEHQNISCVVYDTSGKVYLRTEELPEAGVPPAPVAAPAEHRFHNTTLPNTEHQPLLSTPRNSGGKQVTVIPLTGL